MYKLFNVTGGRGGDSHLVIGSQKTAIFDTGMAWCGQSVVDNIRQVFAAEGTPDRPLDCIFLTHSHYDHLGALPLILEAWPEALVYAAPHTKWVLSRPGVLQAMRRLNEGGAVLFNEGKMPDYDDALMRVDVEVTDGDVVDLGDCPVQILKTPGHTKCSLTFLIDGRLMIANESTGYTSPVGRVNASYIISHRDALASIRRCQELAPPQIISPHYGLLDEEETRLYWAKCWNAACHSRDFILATAEAIRREGREPEVEEILQACFEEFYDEICKREQPYRAWQINYTEAIRTVLREYPDGLVPPELARRPRLPEKGGEAGQGPGSGPTEEKTASPMTKAHQPTKGATDRATRGPTKGTTESASPAKEEPHA